MKRIILLLVTLVVLVAGAIHVATAHADLTDRCRISATGITFSGSDKPIIHLKTYSCPTSSFPFQIRAKCLVTPFNGQGWNQCGNTNVVDASGNGNTTWSIPVGNGSWGCNPNNGYEPEAFIYDADTNTWVGNIGPETVCN